MIKKKVCMVGDFAVGKTSLTQKFVNNVFSEKYLTTVGVKIDTATVGDTKLVVWDVAGRDALSPINTAYLAGAAGIVLVADGTRTQTLESLVEIWQMIQAKLGNVPTVLALNKRDVPGWDVTSDLLEANLQADWDVFETSAKDGSNVAELFAALVNKINQNSG